ncbi:MAG TPA: DUF3043 domain-containing protein [Jatrophihabitans sp.]|uniref:DUF3043 domain-containing protein n=1 Tax=Jatrophihabitans sp. TaxID=1932789 RepID=UPI002EDD3F6B
MNPLRRKAAAAETVTEVPTAPEPEPGPASARAPKGRPTPKRRTNSIPPPPAPKTRKEAAAWQKQQGSKAKVAGQKKLTATEYREAVKAGDPRVLPRRDQGPVRALARDYVDSRRMASNYLLLLFPLMLVGYAIPTLQILTLGLFGLLLAEWIFTGSRIRKLAVSRGLQSRESAVSLGFYAGSRAYFRRSWRRPLPRVELGDEI